MSETSTTQPPVENDPAKRIRRVIAMKNLVPDDWINVNVVAKGKGTHVMVARIYGICLETERKTNDYKGTQLVSIAMRGRFEAESVVTGEIINASTVYMPMAYSEQVELAFRDDATRFVQIDIDVGLEATGKTIPYEWTVINHMPDTTANLMQAMRTSRRPGRAPNQRVTIGTDGTILPLAAPEPVTNNGGSNGHVPHEGAVAAA